MKQGSKNTSNRNFIIAVLLISIISLSGLAYFQFQNFKKSTESFRLPEFKIEMPELKLFPREEEATEKEFVSQDGKLRFSYPSSWLKVEALTKNTDFLARLNEQLVSEETEILFFAHKIDVEESSFAFMIAQKRELAKNEKNLEEIIQMLVEETEDEETSIEITAKETSDNEALLEIDYERTGGVLYRSIKKIILSKDVVYAIEIFSFKDGWQKVKQEAKKILNSAQLVSISE